MSCPTLRIAGAILVVGQVARVPGHPPPRAVAADDRVLEAVSRVSRHDTVCNFCGDGLAVGLGEEQREVVAAMDLVGRVAGEPLGERAEVDDRVVGPEDHDQALGGLDQVAEGGLAPLLGQGELPPLGDPAPGWCGAGPALSGLRM